MHRGIVSTKSILSCLHRFRTTAEKSLVRDATSLRLPRGGRMTYSKSSIVWHPTTQW